MDFILEHMKGLFLFGIALIVFGYWWNSTVYWCIKNDLKLDKRLEEIKINNENFNDLKFSEKFNIRLRDSSPRIKGVCLIVGSIMTFSGFIAIIFY